MTALIVPAADLAPKSTEMLEGLLWSIERGEYSDWPVVVCFDACREPFVHHFVRKYPDIMAIANNGNRKNFAGNANLGLRYAHKQLNTGAVVVNQDCVLPHSRFLKHLEGAGVAVPSAVSLCREPPIDAWDLQVLDDNQSDGAIRTPHKKLVGFCMFLSKELMDKIGYFDESFIASWEDDDICARAVIAGFPVEHVNINVHHYVSRCGAYDGNRLAINLLRFRDKWQVPLDIEHAGFNQWISEKHTWQEGMREP